MPLVVSLVLAAVAFVAFPRAAAAQTITLTQPSPQRLGPDGKVVSKRAANQEPEGISFADCAADQRIDYVLAMTGLEANATVEAWAALSGADCGTQVNRTSGTQVCWPLVKGIPLTTNQNVQVSVRTIMSGAIDAKNPVTSAAVCGTVDLTTIVVQFLYFKPGQLATAATKAEAQVKVDTVGPPALTGVTVLPGNGRLAVSWDAVGEGGVVELASIKAFCDSNLGGSAAAPKTTRVCDTLDADAVDGGDSGDLDAGCRDVVVDSGSSTGGGTCVSPAFSTSANDGGGPILDNDFVAKYQCGEIASAGTGSSLRTNVPLANGTTYAVAVAATDRFLNVGALSTPQCNFPEATNDFWEAYRNGGGGAGGGFCSTNGAGLPVGSLSVLAMMALGAVSMWRRRVAQGRDRR